MEQITNKEILEELKKLRIDVEILKERLIDQDEMLTSEEKERALDMYQSLTEKSDEQKYALYADFKKSITKK